jgi:hypothetical protein
MTRADRDSLALLRETARKLHAERKVMHRMLTEAGVPEVIDGDRTCVTGRLAVLVARYLDA